MKKPALWLALFLFLSSGTLLFYRALFPGYPLLPTAAGQTWAISIDLYVETGTDGAKVALAIPGEQADLMVVAEKISVGHRASISTWRDPIGSGHGRFPGNRRRRW